MIEVLSVDCCWVVVMCTIILRARRETNFMYRQTTELHAKNLCEAMFWRSYFGYVINKKQCTNVAMYLRNNRVKKKLVMFCCKNKFLADWLSN